MRRPLLVLLLAGCGSSPAAAPDALGSDAAVDAPQALTAEDVATAITDPTAIAVDATHVFVVHGRGDISRVAKGGGAPELLTSAQRGPGCLDVSTEQLLWINGGTHGLDFRDGSVRRMPKSGGTDVELSTAYMPSGLAIDAGAGTAYWVELDGQRVRRIQLDGSGAEIIDQSATHKTSIALTPSRIAWTATGSAGDVVTIDRPSGMVRTLSSVEYGPEDVIIVADDVYWIENHNDFATGAIRVSRGGAPPIDLVAGEPGPSNLIRDGGTLYWVSAGRIRRIALAGGAPVTLLEGRGTIHGLASDATHLYWTEYDRAAIVRAAK